MAATDVSTVLSTGHHHNFDHHHDHHFDHHLDHHHLDHNKDPHFFIVLIIILMITIDMCLIIIPFTVRWSEDSYYLKEFLHKYKLPQVIRVMMTSSKW